MIINQYRFAAAGDITTGLINWYKFDDGGEATTSVDSGSQGVTLTNFSASGLGWVTGFIGSHALAVGGSNAQVARANNPGGACDLSGDVTTSTWYNKVSGGVNTNARMNVWTDSAHSYGIQVVMDHTGTEVSVVSTNGSAFTAADTNSAWHQVVTCATNGVVSAAYLDNVLMTSTYSSGTFGADNATGRAYGQKSGGGNQFTGTMDDGRRYTRILSSADRAALFAYR